MEQEFDAQAYEAVCMTMGEAVWQIVASGEMISQEAIARMILQLSEQKPDLVNSIALSVLRGS